MGKNIGEKRKGQQKEKRLKPNCKGLQIAKSKMKTIKTILCLLLILTVSSIRAQEAKQDVKTEQSQTNYKEGDKFDSVDFGTITLVSDRKIQGIPVWKTKAEKEGRKRTIYVPLEYLARCKKIQ